MKLNLDANTQTLIACIILYFSIVLALIALFFCWKIRKSYKKEEDPIEFSEELNIDLDCRWNQLMN